MTHPYLLNPSHLEGKTLQQIDQYDAHTLVFTATTGERFALFHEQDCCESVYLADVTGDFSDLLGRPLTLVQVSSSKRPYSGRKENRESSTWTFYKFATLAGYVDLRWVGESNGYYSEEVSFARIPEGFGPGATDHEAEVFENTPGVETLAGVLAYPENYTITTWRQT